MSLDAFLEEAQKATEIPASYEGVFLTLEEYRLHLAVNWLAERDPVQIAELVQTHGLPGQTLIFRGTDRTQIDQVDVLHQLWLLDIDPTERAARAYTNPAILVGSLGELKQVPLKIIPERKTSQMALLTTRL